MNKHQTVVVNMIGFLFKWFPFCIGVLSLFNLYTSILLSLIQWIIIFSKRESEEESVKRHLYYHYIRNKEKFKHFITRLNNE